ncbi:CubicO group peptidase (beta-lactamase class C family) [Natranaerovirga pectinivora]|uniref:CubicO group peptidase (Beta-lactamase class C family) n=1 Tax=Natranaerovirga pectinivora TaxID=682400 RepID=A0A4R3MQL2_9FIRM|nr:serine hydrolase domain-containing protein [Natranaerovirga pectinivora]TCT17182.1 CubicO group peptidase (beta-lactamase class C family) [Natranaerovirga pectinivora]
MKKNRKIITIIISIFAIMALGIGAFALIISYRMSLIPSMTFEEMLNYTTKDNEDAIITVGIMKNGEIDFTVYGENSTILPQNEFQYEIGSLTKTFTSSLLCKAIDEGNITLSDSIDQYMDLPAKDYYPNLKDLVTHTSGYKNYYFHWKMATNFLKREKNDYYSISTESLNNKLGKESIKEKEHPFKYSNFGISVVGSVLAEAYDSDFTTLMTEFIQTELNLENTTISKGVGDMNGYWNWRDDDAYIPAGGIISTITDMMTYLNIHMTEELPYLSLGHEPLAQVLATTKQYEKMGIRIDAVGISWMIDAENNLIWHNGGTSNFNSYMAFDKELQVGVVILSNLPPKYRIPATVMGVKLITSLQNDDDN